MTKAPPCFHCKQPLETIIPQDQGVAYRWDEDAGRYEVDDAQQQTTFRCGECGKEVGGWRADGVKWGLVPETDP